MDIKQKETQFVLFVGEGDFSYSASYVEKQTTKNEQVYSTCLNSGILNSKQNKNIEIIKGNGGSVLTDVDATKLESHPVVSQVKFRKIIFNFPHVAKKMNIGQNRKLVELFLKSAERILDGNGRVHVSLCKGQGGTDAEVEVREWHNSWQIVELASRAGLMLCDIRPFDVDSFEKYECTGFRGQSKSFNMEAAVTHVFCRQRLVSSGKYVSQKFSEDSLKEWFKSDCTELYRLLSQTCSPLSRLAAVLTESVESKYEQHDSVFLRNLVFSNCFTSSMNSIEESSHLRNSKLCDKCLEMLISTFLNDTERNSNLTCMLNCVCCIFNIDISRCQLTPMISYFSTSEEILMKVLKTVFMSLKESGSTFEKQQVSTWFSLGQSYNSVINNKDTSCVIDGITIKEISSVNSFYSVEKSNCHLFYRDLEFLITNDNIIPDNCFEVGHIIQFTHNMTSYFAAFLDLNLCCQLKYHVMDYRILLNNDSFFTFEYFKDELLPMYRSPSLFPAIHTHDTSFWVNEDFKEMNLFLLVRRTVGLLVKSIKLVEIYCDEPTKRVSRCYRFVYQSHGEIMPKSVVSCIHSQLRLTIEMSLNVSLR